MEKDAGTNYNLSLTSGGRGSPCRQLDGTRLTIVDDKTTLVFDREK